MTNGSNNVPYTAHYKRPLKSFTIKHAVVIKSSNHKQQLHISTESFHDS